LYFNRLAAGVFGNYDEKALQELTLYGLPMLGVSLPVTTTAAWESQSLALAPEVQAGGLSAQASALRSDGPAALAVSLDLSYTAHLPASGRGTYYTVSGHDAVSVAGGRPVQPQVSLNVGQGSATSAQGVLLVGGTFTEVTGFDPLVAQLRAGNNADAEPTYPNTGTWYPETLATLNRFLSIEGTQHEQLVVVPGQFRASGVTTPTVGTERLYTNLKLDVYYAPFEATDFVAPSIWQVSATPGGGVTFSVLVTDDSGQVARVVGLYRLLTSNAWSKTELTYDPATRLAWGRVAGLDGALEYFVQAVDPTGNVALALDHGRPFRGEASNNLYLPLVRK
jgi:hypothetical protein